MKSKAINGIQKRGTLAAAVGSQILWGSLPVYWKWLHELPPYQILVHRVLWSFVFLHLLLTLIRGRKFLPRLLQDRTHRKASLLGGLLVSINWLVYIWSVNNGRIIEASLGYYMMPLMTALFGFFLGESFNRTQWLAFLFAAAGVVVQMLALGTFPIYGLILALAFSSYTVIKKQNTLNAMDSLYAETLFVAPLALAYLLYAEFTGTGITGNLPPSYWLRIMTSGVVTAVPLLLYGYGVRGIPLRLTAFIQYLNPSITLVIGVLLFKEPFGTLRFFSFLLIWIGILIFTIDRLKLWEIDK